jgi:hypothetical protein
MQIEYITSTDLKDYVEKPLTVEGALMAMPFINTSQAQQAAELMSSRAASPGMILAIHDSNQSGFTTIVNAAFKVSQSPYFGYVAQDAYAGRQWLKLAVEALGQNKSFLGFNDGKWAGAIAGFGLAKRVWAQANYEGNFFYPGYQRHYADAELTLLALQAGLYAYDGDSVLIEVDWDKDQASVDPADRALFAQRKLGQFDGRITSQALLDLIA